MQRGSQRACSLRNVLLYGCGCLLAAMLVLQSVVAAVVLLPRALPWLRDVGVNVAFSNDSAPSAVRLSMPADAPRSTLVLTTVLPAPSCAPPAKQAQPVQNAVRPAAACLSLLSPNLLPGNKDGTDVNYVATLVPPLAAGDGGGEDVGDIAFGVHARSRADGSSGCLDLVLRTLRARFPSAAIYVADDGSAASTLASGAEKVSVAVRAGAAHVRNMLLDRAATDGHATLFLMDDTTLLSADVDVRRLQRVMRCTNANIVAPDLCDRLPFNKQHCTGGSSFFTSSGSIEVIRHASAHAARVDGCMRVELPPRVMLVRTAGGADVVTWDDLMRDNEHYDAFYGGAGGSGAGVAMNAWVCPHMHAVSISQGCHSVNMTASVSIADHSDAWVRGLPPVLQKLNVKAIVDEWGQTFTSRGASRDTRVCSNKEDALVSALRTSALTAEQLRGELTSLIDAAVPHTHTRTAVCIVQACVYETPTAVVIRGNVIAEYDNTFVWSRDRIHTDNRVFARIPTSATAVASFMSLLHEEMGPFNGDDTVHPLAFVTANRNGYCYVYRLLVSMLTMVYSGSHVNFILVDFASDDGDYDALLSWAHASAVPNSKGASEPSPDMLDRCYLSASVRTKDIRRRAAADGVAIGLFHGVLLRTRTAFSRTLGLSHAIEHAATLLPPHAVVFIADSAILFPPDMPHRILRMVRCGSSVYAPIAMKNTQVGSHRKALLFRGSSLDGRRIYSGFGMLGFCLSDYAAVGGLDPAFSFHHGGEDIDTIERFAAGRLFVARPKEPGYWHSQHKDDSLLAYKAAANPARALSVVSVLQPLPPGHVMHAGAVEWLVSHDPALKLATLWYAYPASSHLTSHSGRMLAVTEAGDGREQRVLWLHAGFGPSLWDFQSWEKLSSSSRACKNTNAYVPASGGNDAGDDVDAAAEDKPPARARIVPAAREREAPVQPAAAPPGRQQQDDADAPPAARGNEPEPPALRGGSVKRPAPQAPQVAAPAVKQQPQVEEEAEEEGSELLKPEAEQQGALLDMSV